MNTQFPLFPIQGDSAIANEVIAARGGRATLGDRIGVISNFASPNAGGYIVGRYYDNSFHAAAPSTIAGAASVVELVPFYTSQLLPIDQIGVSVATALSSLMRCCIYSSNSQGWPDQLLYEGDSDLSGAAVAYVSHALSFVFQPGTQYWLGVRWNSTTALRSINVSSAVNLGLQNATATAFFTKIRRTIPFTTALPNSWGFEASEVTTGNPVSVRFRAA